MLWLKVLRIIILFPGDKICKMLDDKLAEHVATYGTTSPVNAIDAHSDVETCDIKTVNSSIKPESRHNRQNSSKLTGSKVKEGRQNSQDGLLGRNQNSQRGHQRVHELSDSDEEEVEQPARVRLTQISKQE